MSKRIGLLLMAGALFLVLLSGVALATSFAQVSFQCTDVPCYGTNAHELIRERQGNGKQDDIHARGGFDELRAGRWGNDTDVLRGQKRSDFLNSKDGDRRDVLICGSGDHDEVKADPGDTVTGDCDIFGGTAASQVNVVSEAKAEQIAANRLQ
jgi:hypothetical protein